MPRYKPYRPGDYVTNGVRLVRIIRLDKGDIALVEDAMSEATEYMKLTGWVRPAEWKALKVRAGRALAA